MASFTTDFCRTYANNLSADICDELVAMYRAKPELHIHYDNGGFPNMSQLNFTKNKHIHPALHDYMVNHALKCIDQYRKDVPETRFWPEKFAFEEFRIKHYREGGNDRFDEHIDSNDLISSKRFMIFFWYLTCCEGGETVLTNTNIHFWPMKGRLLMFPPFWMFPHEGRPVKEGEKFLLSSYMHYSE
jgi:prolyl 4-hydroxylase